MENYLSYAAYPDYTGSEACKENRQHRNFSVLFNFKIKSPIVVVAQISRIVIPDLYKLIYDGKQQIFYRIRMGSHCYRYGNVRILYPSDQ